MRKQLITVRVPVFKKYFLKTTLIIFLLMKQFFLPVTIAIISLIFINGCRSSSSKDETGLHLPDDLEATLWAASPMLYNPTNMDVDSKGRIWVTEAVNYRNTIMIQQNIFTTRRATG